MVRIPQLLSLTAVNASNPIPNLPVNFHINDTTLADIIAAPRVTGTDGVASTQITSKKKSGTVLVYATVYYRVNDTDLVGTRAKISPIPIPRKLTMIHPITYPMIHSPTVS